MNAATYADTPRFRVTSHGSGVAYLFAHKPSGASIVVQGDDAAHFQAEIGAWEAHCPTMLLDEILSILWRDYALYF